MIDIYGQQRKDSWSMSTGSKKVFHCHAELAIDIIGGKWKPLILHHIGKSGVVRYGELKRKIPTINERVLTRQLRELEEHHLIYRKVYEGSVLKVEYSPTEIGERIIPALDVLGDFGTWYNEQFNYGEIDFEDEYDEETVMQDEGTN